MEPFIFNEDLTGLECIECEMHKMKNQDIDSILEYLSICSKRIQEISFKRMTLVEIKKVLATFHDFEEMMPRRDVLEYNYYKDEFDNYFFLSAKSIIQKEIKPKIEKWVESAFEFEDYTNICENVRHTLTCKGVNEILFLPVELINEIDFILKRKRSLTSYYFEIIDATLIDYVRKLRDLTIEYRSKRRDSLKKNRKKKKKRKNQKRKEKTMTTDRERISQVLEKMWKREIVLLNNIQASIDFFVNQLKNEDVREIIFGLDEKKITHKLYKKILRKMKIIRNEVAAIVSHDLFLNNVKPVLEKLLKRPEKRIGYNAFLSKKEEIMEMVFEKLDDLAVKITYLYKKAVSKKILEFLVVQICNLLIYKMVYKKGFFEIKDIISIFLNRMVMFFYCGGDGLKMKILKHHETRVRVIMKLFLKLDIRYLINLYGEISKNKVKEKNLSYFIKLEKLDKNNENEIDPIHLELVIKRMGKILNSELGKKFIKEIKKEEKRKKKLEKKNKKILNRISLKKQYKILKKNMGYCSRTSY